MKTIYDGGPAFPCMPPQDPAGGVATGYPYPDSGLTLRDYFAAKAMHQMLAGARMPVGYGATRDMEMVGERAYQMADAMLKARAAT